MAEQRTDSLPLSIYINVVLSFLFMAIGVPVLLWLLALLVAPGWHLFMPHPPLAGECWQLAQFSDSVTHSIIIGERSPDSRSEAVIRVLRDVDIDESMTFTRLKNRTWLFQEK